MSRKSKLIVIAVISALLIVCILAVALSSSSDEAAKQTPPLQDTTVVISRNGLSSDFSTDGLSGVEDALPKYINKYGSDEPRELRASVRPGTLVQTFQPYSGAEATSGIPIQVPTQRFIVDIPDAEQSYAILRAGGPEYPYDNVYVLCPTKIQLKWANFGCVDEDR